MNTRLPTVFLVKPPERSRFNFGAFSLAALATAVQDIADVQILDATHLSLQEAVSKIASAYPDWVGVTTMSLPSLAPACDLITKICRELPETQLIVGGHGASMLPKIPLDAGADAVVRGEGEITLRNLLIHGLCPDLPGIVTQKNGQLIQSSLVKLISPLDKLSSPARDLMPAPKDGVHLMETSRGCPHACQFCETTRFYGKRWRGFSAKRVVAEVQRLVHEFGAWIIEITDDNFAADHQRVLAICKALKSEELPAFFLVSARADDLMAIPDMLPVMADARMLRISVGVETLSPSLARSTGKNIPFNTYQLLFERMRALGIFSVASFIVGLPREKPSDRIESIKRAVEVAPDAAQFVPFHPFPGVPMANHYLNFNPMPDVVRDAEHFTEAFYRAPEVFNRLKSALKGGGIRALLAKGIIEKYKHIWNTA